MSPDDPNATTIKQGAYLPHWTRNDATYAVTFRLVDSLPRSVLEQWIVERDDIIARAMQQGRALSLHESERHHFLHAERIETYLDSGHGECWLRNPAIAQIVAEAIGHFDGERYSLDAWCVMPNHVHVVLATNMGSPLPDILHSWKSHTAKLANRELKRTGEFWQSGSAEKVGLWDNCPLSSNQRVIQLTKSPVFNFRFYHGGGNALRKGTFSAESIYYN